MIGATGVSSVAFFNCHTDRHTVYIWTLDLTGRGSWQNQGELSLQYDGSGSWPAVDATPLRVSLQDRHQYRLIAVDPEGLTCGGQNDPSQVGCQRWSGVVTGASQGQVLPVIIN